MKKSLTILLVLSLLFSVWGGVSAESEETDVPEIERPVRIAVVDEADVGVSGVSMQLLDAERNVLETWTSDGGDRTFFLKEGTYSIEYLSVPDAYLNGAAPVQLTVALTEEETVTDYVGTVTYDHDHARLCSNPSHVGLELYTINGGNAYCFNHGLANPTRDSRYKMLVATPELLYQFARNKDDGISAEDLYDHVIAAIYHTEYVKEAYDLDDAEARYFTYIAIKTFTDPKCFQEFDNDGNSLLVRDEKGRPVRDENGKYVFRPGGTVLGTIMHHVIAETGQGLPENYVAAYNYLIGNTEHPDDYYLYIYYPMDFDITNGGSFQCLLSAKQAEPQKVSVSVRPAARLEAALDWNDTNDADHLRPTSGETISKVHLFANGEDVTALYRDNISVIDANGSYTIQITGLPALDENNEEIDYMIMIDCIEGYQSDMLFVANGETVTYTHTAIGGFTRPKLDPITPIPGKPFRPVRGTEDR